MPVTESRRRANDKWDKENMATLACKVKKADAEKFREKAKREQQTARSSKSARFVKAYIADDQQKNTAP